MYDELINRIEGLLVEKSPVTVGITGYGGSGKSHLANRIADHLGISEDQLLHMDYLHPEPGQPKDKKDVFNDHDWSLIYGILKDAKDGKRLKYRSMGLWGHSKEFDEPAPNVLIIEGVRLLRKEIMPYLDIAVWIDADVDYVTERAKIRDRELGQDEAHIRRWDEEWVPKNDRYIQEVNPKKLANFIFTDYK